MSHTSNAPIPRLLLMINRILNSRLFNFVVGEKVDGHPTTFSVHEDAISQLSVPLYSLLKNGMSESQIGSTIWEDVSEDTFARFAQFAYTGDYSIPAPQKRKSRAAEKQSTSEGSSKTANGVHGVLDTRSQDQHQLVEDVRDYEDAPIVKGIFGLKVNTLGEPPVAKDGGWAPDRAFVGGKKIKKDKREKRQLAKSSWEVFPIPEPEPAPEPVEEQDFESIPKREKYPDSPPQTYAEDFYALSFPLLAPRSNYDSICDPPSTCDSSLSYSEQFLSYAALYILGDCHLIDPLKALALHKLHKTLCVFQLSAGNAQDVVDLARLAYTEEGGGGGGGDDIGRLRSLVCRYLATHALVLSFDEGFMDLLEEGGQFVRDFFKFEVQMTR